MSDPTSSVPPPPPSGPGGNRPARGRSGAVQPFRALAIVALALVVAVVVLARMPTSPAKPAAARSGPTTTARAGTSTTTAPSVTSTTATTLPPTTTSTTLAPSSVTVAVLNGWTTAHGALYFQHQLSAQGYDTRAPANAISDTNKTSAVFFTSVAYRANALALASFLGLPATSVLAPTATNDVAIPPYYLSGTDIILLIGADISSRVPASYGGG